MQNVEMPKDYTFKVRLEDREIAALETLAERRGLKASQVVRQLILAAAEAESSESDYRVSAWDGMSSTCLFWFGRDRAAALAKAKELARTQPENSRWTVFRVYFRDEQEPIARESVKRPKK